MLEEVERRIKAYHHACPELDRFLADEVDAGAVVARLLNLTPVAYRRAIGRPWLSPSLEDDVPQAWLGHMLLKTLGEEVPRTQKGQGRPYKPEELDFFWARPASADRAQAGAAHKLMSRQADRRLQRAVSNRAGRRPVFTLTGRLRAGAAFCAARNTIFQGLAADGAIIGMWNLWCAGYRIVSFIHDQAVVEVREDDLVEEKRQEVIDLMRRGMLEVVPGMKVQVEAVVTRSLNKTEVVSSE